MRIVCIFWLRPHSKSSVLVYESGCRLGAMTTQFSEGRHTSFGGGWGWTMSSHHEHLILLSAFPHARVATCIRCDRPFGHALGVALSDPGNHESAFTTRTPRRCLLYTS